MRVPGCYLEVRPKRYGIGLATVEEGVRLIGNIDLGEHSYLSAPAEINGKDSLIEIGPGCDIAGFVTISTADSHKRCIGASNETERRPIRIGRHVFVGQGAIILGGCDIGDYSVIGAGVVLKNAKVPAHTIVRVCKPYWPTSAAAPTDVSHLAGCPTPLTCQDFNGSF